MLSLMQNVISKIADMIIENSLDNIEPHVN